MPTDISRLEKVFEDGIQSNDLQTIFYSARHSKSLTKDEEAAACKKLLTAFSESKLNVCIFFEFERKTYKYILTFSRISRRIITYLEPTNLLNALLLSQVV